ncbi:hypothetical protein [Arthrobacter sp. R4-81]
MGFPLRTPIGLSGRNETAYEHADRRPDFTGQTVCRFMYGQEPHLIAQVPLVNGDTIVG